MKLYGGIDLGDGGMVSSLRDMFLQSDIMSIINRNIVGFNKVGYQQKTPVVSSFAEFMGPHALSENVNEDVGRLKITRNPLDVALATKGYFQVLTPNGIQLTRDGRFKMDKNGSLLDIQNNKVLSSDGTPIRLRKVPKQLEDIKIDTDGTVTYLDPASLKVYNAGKISVVSSEGKTAQDIDVKQSCVEESNVTLNAEIFGMVPVRRNYEANRQAFLIQNDALSKMIQELGRA